MQISLKEPKTKFNLLYLEYTECLFNSIRVYTHNIIENCTLHINSSSLIFDSDEISNPLIKLKFDENFTYKSYKLEELVKFYQNNFEVINNKDSNTAIILSSNRDKNITSNMINQNSINSGNKNKKVNKLGADYQSGSGNTQFNYNFSGGNNNNNNTNSYKKNFRNSAIINNINPPNSLHNTGNLFVGNNTNNNFQISKNNLVNINPIFEILEFEEILKNNLIPISKEINSNQLQLNINSPTNFNLVSPKNSPIVDYSLQNLNQVGTLNPNFITNNSKLQKSKKFESRKFDSFFQKDNNFLELYNYFLEHNLNLSQFLEIFNNLEKTFNNSEKLNENTFSVVIIKGNNLRKIKRNMIGKYEDSELTKSYLFIIEGKMNSIDKFLSDVLVFRECFGKYSEMEIVNRVTDRIMEELKVKFELEKNKSESDENNNLGNNFNNIDKNKITNTKSVGFTSVIGNKFNPSNSTFNNNSNNNFNNNLNEDNNSNNRKILYVSKANRILPEKNQNGIFIIYYLYNDINKNNEIKDSSNNKNNNIKINNNFNNNIYSPYETICEYTPINNFITRTNIKFNLFQIKALIRYRFLYQYKAINIVLYNKKRTIIIDFENEENFKEIYNYLLNNTPKLDKHFTDVRYHTNMWVDGLMSNYDYLMYLNLMSGRSFNDLGQYPIMPWVIINYEDDEILDLNDQKNFRDLSKPIGALNLKRLKNLKDNYMELKEQGNKFPFLYGTYYSFPYIVFYYLIRIRPLFYLRFQGGSFGPCDRLFLSVKDCWNSSFKNLGSQDVKELIPEFYNSDGEFLKNLYQLEFGKTQNDEIVNDVILPKWAKSGQDFINIMRAALESEIVSHNLNLWIDLVFGYKQRGEKALEAENLFHYLRYDDKYNLNLGIEKTDEENQGEIDNIFEFGQIPIQLFVNEPHPKRRSKFSIIEIDYDSNSNKGEYFVKVSRLKKERMNMEKKYEKERRHKEKEVEEILKKFEDKDLEFNLQVKDIEKKLNDKEAEFAAYFSTLMDQNSQLKHNFNNYDFNKDSVYKKWIHDVKKKHDVELQQLFADKMNLYKYIKDLENTQNNFKNKERIYFRKSNEIDKQIEQSHRQEKALKEEIFFLQKVIRSLPYDQQIYLNKKENINENGKEKEISIKKMIKEIK